jgi:hypothetical protein
LAEPLVAARRESWSGSRAGVLELALPTKTTLATDGVGPCDVLRLTKR